MALDDHTPGPWTVGAMTSDGDVVIHGGKKASYVCRVAITQIGGGIIGRMIEDERRANANLIAAAPDMKAALDQVLHEMDAGFGSSFGETREQVRRALSRARGAPEPRATGENSPPRPEADQAVRAQS